MNRLDRELIKARKESRNTKKLIGDNKRYELKNEL